jgi:hypothetical protein
MDAGIYVLDRHREWESGSPMPVCEVLIVKYMS